MKTGTGCWTISPSGRRSASTPRNSRAVEGVQSLNPGRGHHPIRLELLGHGEVADFAAVCPWLFGESRHWHSLTPYVLTRHIKYRGPKDELGRRRIVDGPEEQIEREANLRWPERSPADPSRGSHQPGGSEAGATQSGNLAKPIAFRVPAQAPEGLIRWGKGLQFRVGLRGTGDWAHRAGARMPLRPRPVRMLNSARRLRSAPPSFP